MRRLFGCPDIVSLTEKFLMARNFYRIFTENNPVMGDSKTFGIPEAKGLKKVCRINICASTSSEVWGSEKNQWFYETFHTFGDFKSKLQVALSFKICIPPKLYNKSWINETK